MIDVGVKFNIYHRIEGMGWEFGIFTINLMKYLRIKILI